MATLLAKSILSCDLGVLEDWMILSMASLFLNVIPYEVMLSLNDEAFLYFLVVELRKCGCTKEF